jgi:cation diffusion facilitator CzcD-associated flavoprotein CzcO
MAKISFLFSTLVFSFLSSSFASPEYHRYIIVGAGPGGLQLGHYMDTAERDYLILDKVREVWNS